MLKKLAVLALVMALAAPFVSLVGIGLLMNPTANATCTIIGNDTVTVGDVPDELAVTTAQGETFTLNNQQLTHAATIIETGSGIEGINRDGLQIALMAALTESTLRMLSNTSTYPESADYPNDGDGSDHDSLGLFQMRPQTGWGSVEELMDPVYQAEAFFGGPEGPNGGSPRGLLDIPGWQEMGKGEAAQAVEVSAHPERYENYSPVAVTILDTLTGQGSGSPGPTLAAAAPVTTVAETSRMVFPLPEGTWVATDPFGPRTHPITGEEESFHTGADFAAPDGTPILAAADGEVTVADYSDQWGGQVVVEHTIDGETIATAYIHSWEHGIHVTAGDQVTAGQHIADVGSSGMSTGPHLHFEVRDGGTDGEHIDPAAWLNTHDAADLPEAETGAPEQENCDPDQDGSQAGAPEPYEGPDPDELVDDPTTDGQITRRMLHLYRQTSVAFPDASWACYSPRPGQASDHPLGRACDLTFGNAIGQYPTPAQSEYGWEVTNWLIEHAETLDVAYLIWEGRIWTPGSGWRDYNGGGMHDPDDVTGGHWDHLHISQVGGVS